MRELSISIEKNGKQAAVGTIRGNTPEDAVFQYAASWLDADGSLPVSLSLPLQEAAFPPERTRNYFEGLLPEGFTRRAVAQWLHADENDYLTILSGLGLECLGAVQVREAGRTPADEEYVPMTDSQMREFAAEGAMKSAELVTESHLSLTGASGKAGLYFDRKAERWYIPRGTAPSTHIVKQCQRLANIISNERLCLLAAKNLEIPTPENFLIRTDSPGLAPEHADRASEGNLLFAAERFDREISPGSRTLCGLPVPFRLHQEDMAQALGIPAGEKYETEKKGYLQRMCRLLREYSGNPLKDILRLWQMLVFNFLIGNTDGHIKNFSLLYDASFRRMHLAPAYDIVSTTVYPGSSREMSLFIGGKSSIEEIRRADFALAAEEAGLGTSAAMRQFDRLAHGFGKALHAAADTLQDEGFPAAKSIHDRILETSGYRNL